jgi:cerevisin
MSVATRTSLSMNKAIELSMESGVSYGVAAGNYFTNACQFSPGTGSFLILANVVNVLTVGSTTRDDQVSLFSNYGVCVDIFAPGSDIIAGWIGDPNGTQVLSGTSMATPHVVGVMALLLSEHDYSPLELKNKILKLATVDVLKYLPSKTPNLFLVRTIFIKLILV